MIDVIVLGGGAAGLMCAGVAAAKGSSVLVLEGNDTVGKKIRISGGGRCNFTNIGTTHRNFISSNPDFCRSALSRYTPDDFISMIDEHGIAWHEKKLGQLFCDGSSQQIIDMLVQNVVRHGGRIITNCTISTVGKNDHFVVNTSHGEYEAKAVVVATGGLSIPTIGATDIGYRIATGFGHKVIPTAPALVPLTFDGKFSSAYGGLSGVSADCVVSIGETSFRENILFTHRGLSGPSVLQISSYWQRGTEIEINVLPDHDLSGIHADRTIARKNFGTVLGAYIPQRVVEALHIQGADVTVAELSKKDLLAAMQRLQSWNVIPSGTEGYAKAEVTRGGVDTMGISQKTMESKTVPGLYFIGEVVDVTGWLGGYNFQWAWASGQASGLAV